MTTGDPSPPYETQDTRAKPLVVWGLLLILLVVGAALIMGLTFRMFERQEAMSAAEPNPMEAFRERPPGPVLQVDPSKELAAARQLWHERLTSYGWVAPESGVIHIPIDRAISLYAERQGTSR